LAHPRFDFLKPRIIEAHPRPDYRSFLSQFCRLKKPVIRVNTKPPHV
jgi:hypothetical protein